MPNKEKTLSPQESLALIQSMIETTRHSMSDKSQYFLLWGWAVMIGCMLQYFLKVIINYPQHYYAWFITFVALAIQLILSIKEKKNERVKTFIGAAHMYLWTALGLSFFALGFIFSKLGWQYCYPFYIILYGVGTYVSGSLIKFKPLIIGGILTFPIAIATPYFNFDTQILMLALAILISYIIPGHLLRKQYRK